MKRLHMELIVGLAFVFVAHGVAAQSAPTVEQIIGRMEANQTFSSAHAQGRMIVHDRFGERTTSFESWSKGTDHSLIEFTSPGEAGQKILRIGDQVYLYYPDAAELIRLRGSALRDSVMGSDMSYEDMTSGGGILADYSATLAGTEDVDGQSAYRIELVAKNRNVPYARETIWIDTKRYVGLRTQMYAVSGDVLKVSRTLELRDQGGRLFPTKVRIEDKLHHDTYTELVFDSIEVDAAIDDSRFSLDELTF